MSDGIVFSDCQITAAARALCKDSSADCNVDFEDNWKLYSDIYRDQVLIVLSAVNGIQP